MIGFAGSLPQSEVLMQMVEQLKKDSEKTGNTTVEVIIHSDSGQEEKQMISLKGSTIEIVAQIKEKIHDTKPLSVSATLAN